MKKPITILYVDDNRLDRELVRDALTNDAREFKVVEAASRTQFNEYFTKGGYDLVLSDFNILGFEGLQVLETIQAKSPGVPVIIVTGTGSEEVAVEAMKKGATDYVIKTTKQIRRLPLTIKAALEKKKMEQERHEAEKALSEAYKIINRSPAVAFLWKNEAGWPVEFVSENVEKLFGYSDKEFLEGKVSYSEIIHSSDLETVAAEVASYSKKEGQRTFAHNPYRIITKNGDIKWIDDITYIRRDSRGKITHYEGIVYDITERVKSRKKLEEALEKAKEGERVKSLFLANMSHEIRTPLNAILGFTGLIETSTQHLVSDEEKGFFDTVKHSSDRLMRTVHEILDISQIAAGTYDSNMEDLELCNLVRDIVNECRPMADEKSLTLECTTDLDSAFIHADKYGVSQAISNLIDNAIKYTEQGKITVLLEESAEQYVLSIQDTGIGISREYIDNLYEVFSQESEGYTKKFQGIGLGMAIAKRHLDLNHVDINVESTKGVGTTFTLTFKPVKKRIPEKQVEKEEIKVTPPPEPMEKPMVLLVEDDHSSQKLTEYFLQGTHDVCFSVSVEEAKQQLKKQQVDLILLDLSLIGKEDGLDLARHLRKTKKWRNIPIIALTAHAFITDRDNCITAGCSDYLSKPIKREKLIEKISKFV